MLHVQSPAQKRKKTKKNNSPRKKKYFSGFFRRFFQQKKNVKSEQTKPFYNGNLTQKIDANLAAIW